MIELELASMTSYKAQSKSAIRIVIAYKTFGPYHIARLRHVAEQARQEGIYVEGLALAGKQETYSWLEAKGGGIGFPSTILFPGETLERVSKVQLYTRLKDYIGRVKPSIVFTSLYASFPMAYLAIATLFHGGRAVVMADSTRLDHARNWVKEKIKSIALLPYSGVFVSGLRAKEYIQSLGMPQQNIVCGVDVVDNRAISSHIVLSSSSKKQNLICVARLSPEKNLFRLIDAYALYKHKYSGENPLTLYICGSGPLENRVRQHAQRVGGSGVNIVGFVQQPELYSWFGRARALILPSISEPWGLVVNEAMAAGLPVLVSEKCGCVPELVQPDKTGWSFNPEDIEEMAKLMSKIDKLQEKEYQYMSNASRNLISSWDLDRFSNGILSFAKKLSN